MTATDMLALIGALSAIPTDINIGSQVRTLAEAIGAVAEEEGIAGQSLALQALAYGAMSLFGVGQTVALAATVPLIFATSIPVSGAPVAPQAVAIPSGTLVQTQGGIQFATVAGAVLASGTSSVTVGGVATMPGSVGNVGSGAISGTPLTSIGYPLYVTNAVPATGGTDAGTQSQAIAQFTAQAAALGLSSPIAVANACIGVTVSGTGETVQFASCFEPWIAAGSGAGSGVAGFTLYVDNGTGGATSALVSAVTAWIGGNVATNNSGYRPAGVPYVVSGVTPVFASVTVSGTLFPGLLASGSVQTSIVSGIASYFGQVGIAPAAAYQPQIAAQAADAGAGAFESLSVLLYYTGSGIPVPVVSGAVGTRVILNGLTVNVATQAS
jgi:hypothetical protein